MIPLSAAPYAHSLRPGASVQGTGTALNLSSSATTGSVLDVNATAGTGDAAAVYGSSQSSAGAGLSGSNGSSGYGVYGSALTGYGVYGRSGGASGKLSLTGVGVWGDSGSGIGLYGTSNSAAGVFGMSTSNAGVGGVSTDDFGVQGISTDGTGVHGTAATTGTAGIATGGGTTYGVYGKATSSSGHGVFGTSPSTDYQVAGVTGSNTGGGAGAGVYGYSLGGYGVHGRATNGTGVYGSGSTTGTVGLATGTGTTYGVYGRATSLSGRGLYGEGGFYGLYAVGTDSTGLSYGAFAKTDTTGTGYGVRAEANGTETGYGGYFEASDNVGLYAKGDDGGARTVGDIELGGSWGVIAAQDAPNSSMSLVSNDDLFVYLDNNDDDGSSCFSVFDPGDSPLVPFWEVCHPGTIASTVKTEDHGNQKLYATQSTDPWVDHFGTATLAQGSVTVPIDGVFAQTVSLDHYHVFLTPLGDCNGLFVEAKGPVSFEVRELAGGASSVSFDYQIVARRSLDSEGVKEVGP
jgi:hypothetical protein